VYFVLKVVLCYDVITGFVDVVLMAAGKNKTFADLLSFTYSRGDGGPNFFWGMFKGQNFMFLHTQIYFMKILGFAGQIESFSGPHLAQGPYGVHT
jgi:hypothetical protein